MRHLPRWPFLVALGLVGTWALAGSPVPYPPIIPVGNIIAGSSGQVIQTGMDGKAAWAAFPTTLGLADGAAGSPPLYFANSPTTGLYSTGSSAFDIATNGVNRVSIDSAGVTILTGPLSFTGATTITAAQSTTLNPYGVAAGNTGQLRFAELAANGTNYDAFKAPDSLAGNVVWTLPTTDGTSGYALTTNGSGVLSWAAAGSGTVTSVATGTGLTGGTITTTGTVSLSTPVSIANGGTGGTTYGGTISLYGAGNVTCGAFDGSNVPSCCTLNGSTYTCAAGCDCADAITVSTGKTVITPRLRSLISITLSGTATIKNDGAAGSAGTGGAGGVGGNPGPLVNGGAGGSDGVGAGGAGNPPPGGTPNNNSGNGGDGVPSSGGIGFPGAGLIPASCVNDPLPIAFGFVCDDQGGFYMIWSGCGGGAGGGDGLNSGGGGGGGGGAIWLAAPTITIGASAKVTAKGGNGVTPAAGNTGGGGGGSGAAIRAICHTCTDSSAGAAFSVAGGSAGAGHGTGSAGTPGGAGDWPGFTTIN